MLILQHSASSTVTPPGPDKPVTRSKRQRQVKQNPVPELLELPPLQKAAHCNNNNNNGDNNNNSDVVNINNKHHLGQAH